MKLPRLPGSIILLRIAAVTTLISLALIVWSLTDPTVVPVMVSMSVAQGFFVLAFGLYVIVILRDLNIERKARRSGSHPIVKVKAKNKVKARNKTKDEVEAKDEVKVEVKDEAKNEVEVKVEVEDEAAEDNR